MEIAAGAGEAGSNAEGPPPQQGALRARGDVSQLGEPVCVRRPLLVGHAHVHLVDEGRRWLRLLPNLLQVWEVV